MKTVFALIFTLTLLSISTVYAAPAMWGIAVNNETKQCAGYWSGDEFTQYDLPNGWSSYYPNYENENLVETEVGACTFTNQNDAEACCNQLDYTYVSNNIGEVVKTPSDLKQTLSSPTGIVISVLLMLILFIFVKSLLKKRKS